MLCRLKESESTFQKRLGWAQGQTSSAAAPGLFDFTLQDTSRDEVYIALKEALATLSPEVRLCLHAIVIYEALTIKAELHMFESLHCSLMTASFTCAQHGKHATVCLPKMYGGPTADARLELAIVVANEF